MSEMVERVARALHAMHGAKEPFEPYADIYRDQARAAIEAMREPTDEMCKAAGLTQYSAGFYQEMIRAALCEKVDA